MIDMHNHILYGIDDGCKTIEESIETIKNMKKIGFNSIVLTPHYIEDSLFKANNNLKLERLEKLKEELLKNNIDVNLFLGNEIFINESINELIINKEIRSINNTRYILIELPFNNQILNLDDYLYELKLKGYKIIIAHPERYTFTQEEPEIIYQLANQGVLMQSNYGSIIGQYGKKAQVIVEKMLENNLVHFLGSDVHRHNSIYTKIEPAIHKIKAIVGQSEFDKISHFNAMNVIRNERVEVEEPEPIKLTLADKMRMSLK